MPRKCDALPAKAARAATTGVSSPASCKSTSIPSMWSPPSTVRPSTCRVQVAPIRISRSRRLSPACVVVRGHPGTVTRPPVTRAAARKGAAFERSGSTTTYSPRMGPAATRHHGADVSVVSWSTATPAALSMSTVMSMCGSDGTGPPICRTSSPSSNRAATSRSALTNCDDAEASSETDPPLT